MDKKVILVTGSAGFIGYHLCSKLINEGHDVIGVDNINNYYDPNIKYSRLNNLGFKKVNCRVFNSLCESNKYGKRMIFYRTNLQDSKSLETIFKFHKIDVVCNLAAQAGVRYSLENPREYIDSNIVGYLNILENCRHFGIKRLVYASSSSVYGKSENIPFTEKEYVDKPISLYAASKKSNELMAHTYSHLFNFETIGLRFFTVYGPWGRPDMALFLFTDAIINGRPINVFNFGDLSRDFTYIDDIISGLSKTIIKDSKNIDLYKIYNIGNSNPVNLFDFIKAIEEELGISAEKKMLPMQLGDVKKTWSDVSNMKKDYDYDPKIPVKEGIKNFVNWYKLYFNK